MIFNFKNFEDKKKSPFDARFYIFKRLRDFTEIKINSVTIEMLEAGKSIYSQQRIFDWTDIIGLGGIFFYFQFIFLLLFLIFYFLFSIFLYFKFILFFIFKVRTKILDVVSTSKAFVFSHRGKERESAGFFQAALYL